MENLPEEIVNKIYMMLPPHQVVKMIEDDRVNMVLTGDGQTWDEFVRIHLNQYRNKMRKKPKHFTPIQKHIRRYKDLCEWRIRKKYTIEPFHIYALKQNCPRTLTESDDE